jgi:hypothetical protein
MADQFYQYRGVAKCLSAGISVLTDKFWRMLWLTLPVMLLLAAVVGTILYIGSDASQFIYSKSGWWIVSILALITLVLMSALLAVVYQLMDLKHRGVDWQRVKLLNLYGRRFVLRLAYILITLLITSCVLGFIIWLFKLVGQIPLEPGEIELIVAKVGGYVVLVLLFIAVAVPANQCVPSVVLGEGNVFKRIWRGYMMGWKKWGKVFGLSLLSYIIVFTLTALLFSPAIIGYFVRQSATVSLLQGDAVDLPSHFALWSGVLFVVSAYIIGLVQLVNYMPQAYLYASIKKDLEEAKKNRIPIV